MNCRTPVSIESIVSRFVTRSYSRLNIALTEDEDRGSNLMKTLHNIYINAAKILILIRFNNTYPKSEDFVNYLNNFDNVTHALEKYVSQLQNLYNIQLDDLRTPMFDVLGAIDVVVGHGRQSLPLCISRKPQELKFEGDRDKMIEIISLKLISFLSTQNIPLGAQMEIENGVARITLPEKYRLEFTLNELNGSPVCSKIEILAPKVVIPNKDTRYSEKDGNIFLHSVFLDKLQFILTDVIKKTKEDKFMAVHQIMVSFLVLFEFARLWNEITMSKEFAQLNGNDLRVQFWENAPEEFILRLTKKEIQIICQGRVIGNAVGRSFEDIFEECMQMCAMSRLKNYAMKYFDGSDVKCINGLPVIIFEGISIYLSKTTGDVTVLGNNNLRVERDKDKMLKLGRILSIEKERKKNIEKSITEDW